ncbi:MAG: Reverse transcriptase (RNA-dependent DNA polymerase) [Verrucomicrobia bacterium ADurb.Bin118]|nr:MAG: Reverse transcriptase (RNA-dependent DNA polymerase) [Verrucomicrobia bacterium ADurb.Bin118]
MPMLHWNIQAQKVRRRDDGSLERKPPKDRPICYAAHKDAAIYGYYGQLLAAAYESKIRGVGITDCVTAFRESCKRCNIDFAQEAFEWIGQKGECTALAFDIKGFFDNLDHTILKAQWCRVLGTDHLPEDHYAVFRSLSKFAFVDRAAVFREFGISAQNPRANQRKRICSPLEFRERVRGKHLVQTNTSCKGIPQGSPMSAVLSNIYMWDFDVAVAQHIQAAGGLYRRYCDDMLCVVPLDKERETEDFVLAEIQKVKLEVQGEKTKRHHFRIEGGKLSADEPLQYLGFIFDGHRTLLRTASVARYYRKMRAAVRLAVQTKRKADAVRAEHGEAKEPLKRRKLNIRYSYVGRHNFISYAIRAAKKMVEPAIRRQVKSHWKKLNAEVEKAQARTGS